MKVVIPALVVMLVVFAGIQAVRGRVAPTPEVFAAGVSLDDGIRSGTESGKPVVAVVTADWCPPCQMLKRETLADASVSAWIEQNAVGVYVDSDKNPEAAQALGVQALPTTVVLRDGKIVGSKTGFLGTEDYLEFLKVAAAE
jgi:thioredoxin 1